MVVEAFFTIEQILQFAPFLNMLSTQEGANLRVVTVL